MTEVEPRSIGLRRRDQQEGCCGCVGVLLERTAVKQCMMTTDYGSPLLAALQDGASESWENYVEHAFIRMLGDGTLRLSAFQKYLRQDYIFLAHFSRAWALAVVKSETLDEMRITAATVDRIVNDEIRNHVAMCSLYGLNESDLLASHEAVVNLAYSRFVMDTGVQGDLLDLLATLAPCVFGYGEIGLELAMRLKGVRSNHPYRDWIEGFAGDEYQQICRTIARLLEIAARHRLGDDPLASYRWRLVQERFDVASRLEADFWNMCLAA